MRAYAPATGKANISAQIAQLPYLPMDNLWALWDEYFEERPNHHHRTWLESRLAYKIQERAFGVLNPAVRRQLEAIGETSLLPKYLQREANQLLPGTVLSRVYDHVEHRVVVHGPRNFEYEGQRFKSLSAIARLIAGCPWSGPVFFGLKSSHKKKAAL